MRELLRFVLTLVPLTLVVAVGLFVVWSAIVVYTTWLVARAWRAVHPR